MSKRHNEAKAKIDKTNQYEIKEAIGRSPDYSDMLAMRMYFELVKEMEKDAYNPPNIARIVGSKAKSEFGGVEW